MLVYQVMQKLQQHSGKMQEQLEFVKGFIVAAAVYRYRHICR